LAMQATTYCINFSRCLKISTDSANKTALAIFHIT
jgi:hypothetical protein